MNDRIPQLTTSQAANILDVHESSVKRWCGQDELSCTYTAGGHRRISLDDLLDFAQEQGIDCSLLPIRPHDARVWRAVLQSEKKRNFPDLVDLIYTELLDPQSPYPGRILHLCRASRIPISTLFDELIAPVLNRIGDAWSAGEIHVGDEHRMSESLIQTLAVIYDNIKAGLAPTNENRPTAIVGCGEGIQHDIGARIIRILLEESGWNAIYLGANVPTEEFAAQQTKHHARLVCISLVPPATAADADRTKRILARMYDGEHPYSLILGGSGVKGYTSKAGDDPFDELTVFEDTVSFAAWATGGKQQG